MTKLDIFVLHFCLIIEHTSVLFSRSHASTSIPFVVNLSSGSKRKIDRTSCWQTDKKVYILDWYYYFYIRTFMIVICTNCKGWICARPEFTCTLPTLTAPWVSEILLQLHSMFATCSPPAVADLKMIYWKWLKLLVLVSQCSLSDRLNRVLSWEHAC